jgi:hypothetical protein
MSGLIILVLLGTCIWQIQAAFKGKLIVMPLGAVTHEQTDGWLGEPDLFVKVRAYMMSNESQAKKSEVIEVELDKEAIFSKTLKFKGKGPWTKMEVSVIDRDKDEYGEGKDDVLLGPEEIIFDKAKGEKNIEDDHAGVLFSWHIKEAVEVE